MLVVLFRSRLTAQAGADYTSLDADLSEMVKSQDGFIDVKSFTAADDERLTVVWWRDHESLAKWKTLPRHAEAQRTGRQRWYEYYKMEVAEVVRISNFERAK
jgi:heme-degrading monooxygenase HmoA